MRRTLLCALTALVLLPVASILTSPAEAAKVRVSMQQPRTIDGDRARLVGRVQGRKVVTIQRYAVKKHRWVKVKRVRTNAKGRYRTTVRATAKPRYFRAVAARATSPVRAVTGTALSTEPQTPVTQDPPTEPLPPTEPPTEPLPPTEPEPPTVPEGPTAPEPPTEPEPPTVPETPTALTDACGVRPVKADGSLWSCTLNEDFDGTELDRSLWQPATGYLGGSEPARPCYVDDPSVISVGNGKLRLGARRADAPVTCSRTSGPTDYIAGGINTYRTFSQQYGRFEARFKSTDTDAPGLQEAFWLWPDDRYNTAVWPAAGEIDIVETFSQYPDLAIPYLHYTWYDNGGGIPGLNTAWNCVAKRGEWNTYALEWTADRLNILVNGKTCLVNKSGDPAFQKPYIVALTQLLGTGDNMYTGKAPLPATMTVDYVRVWK